MISESSAIKILNINMKKEDMAHSNSLQCFSKTIYLLFFIKSFYFKNFNCFGRLSRRQEKVSQSCEILSVAQKALDSPLSYACKTKVAFGGQGSRED